SLSASSIMLVATITVEPSSLSARIIFHISSLLGTSRKAVGSSNTAILGRCARDRKSTRLNSSHLVISYAVFCLKKKKKKYKRENKKNQNQNYVHTGDIYKIKFYNNKEKQNKKVTNQTNQHNIIIHILNIQTVEY